MNNIQDEIAVGESAASIDAYAATDPAECFAVLRNIFSVRLNCSRLASRPCGSVFATFTARIRWRVDVRMACRTKAIGALFTKTTC
jgi:Mlc titration factor MtfA (ptsG expression regulator)